MKTPLRHVTAIVSALILMLCVHASNGSSATWKRNARSGDWNTKTNWTPATVPDGSSDTATFALSNTTDVSISANTEVNGITFTAAATNPYTITANPGLTLTISGITNNSGVNQTFRTEADTSGNNSGTIAFSNSATAGSNVSIFNDGGTINFLNTSTAGSAAVMNFSDLTTFARTNFFNRSTAGNSAIVESGSVGAFSVSFANNSTAGSAFIDLDRGGSLQFTDNSTAANSTTSTQFSAHVQFSGNSTAGSAHIGVLDGSFLEFSDNSTAGSATIGGNSYISFEGSSRGGKAQISLSPFFIFHAFLDISGHNAPGVTIGSLEGSQDPIEGTEPRVFLGANNLTVGSNNLNTTFSGGIGGTGGSLTKIGTGTLDLTGANTYTGNTNIDGGVLKVDGSITSNTFVNHFGTLAGTGTVGGTVVNAGVVSPGDAPGTVTVNGNYTQMGSGTLLIDIAGASAGQFSVLDVLGTANLNGQLDPVLLNGFIPTVGESFAFLLYGSHTGSLFIHDPNIDDLMEHWMLTYEPGEAILTVASGNVSVPDQGPSFLLLALSFLGVAANIRLLRCKQA